jgi:hypothetical protein
MNKIHYYLNKRSWCTLLLKQKKLPVLDMTGFFFRIRTRAEKEICYFLYGQLLGALLYKDMNQPYTDSNNQTNLYH